MEIYYIWIGLIIFQYVTCNITVSCPCTFNNKLLFADCSKKSLGSISEIADCVPKSTQGLSLTHNNISSIPTGIFAQWPSLRSLYLDYNEIEYLSNGAFDGLPKLVNLSVSYNRLGHNDSISISAFKTLRRLQRLSLQGNCNVHATRCVYPDKALSRIPSLQYLHLDGIPNTNFGPGFSHLKHLNYLYLSNDNGYCSLPSLTEDTFSVFNDIPISNLTIESCIIGSLRPNVFRWMHNLTTLMITRCNKLCSDGIENATIGLNETQIQTIMFNYWCKNPPFFPLLAKDNFKSLKTTSLKYLDLGWNNIYYIDPSVIENLPLSIQYISLKENSITTAAFLEKFDRLENLIKFDGSYQSHFQRGVTYKKQNSANPDQKAYLENITHKTVSNHFEGVSIFQGTDSIHLPRNLEILYINNIKLGYPVPSIRFHSNKLRYLNASSCMLTAFLGPWYGLHNLQHLDISHNRFQFIHPMSFVDMRNLTHLYLQKNEIGNSLTYDQNGETFSSLHQLTELDLSNNNIKHLPYHILKGPVSLRNLSLADNALKNVSFSLNALTKLRYLNLSGNEIEYISDQNLNILEHIAENGDISLDISNNNLVCICTNRKIIQWLANTKVHIIRKNELNCLYINQTYVSLSDIKLIQEQLEYECTAWMVVTSCVIGFIGLLLLLSLVVMLYYKRWQLRYLWYIGTLKMDPFHHPDDRDQPLLHIDAYISYEEHYEVGDNLSLHEVVTDRLYPYFEERGYALKIREEFDGNERLYNAIPETVRRSRKVVVFLTPSFCDDYWNTFEFNIAAYEGIYMKRSVVVPVLLGDVRVENLTPEIRSFVRSKLKSNEVIRFPSHVNSVELFMEQLESLLRR